jgi:hypothetical protein
MVLRNTVIVLRRQAIMVQTRILDQDQGTGNGKITFINDSTVIGSPLELLSIERVAAGVGA